MAVCSARAWWLFVVTRDGYCYATCAMVVCTFKCDVFVSAAASVVVVHNIDGISCAHA